MIETFTHDELGRLTHWASAQGDVSGAWSMHYDYDDIGNIKDRDYVSPEGFEEKYSYFPGPSIPGWGGPHAVTEVDLYQSQGVGGQKTKYFQSYAYDGAGRQVMAVTPSDNRTQTFTDFDLPRQITGNQLTWSFLYGANHQRAAKVVSLSGSPAGSTVYLGKLYEKRTDSSGVVSHVMYVLGEGGAAIAQRTQPDSGGPATIDYLHNDRLGSVANISSSDGSSTKVRFDPFGARLSTNAPPNQSSNPLPRMTLGFIGQENEDDLGLVNLNGRIYDPNLMRFLSADPVISRPMNSQGYNRYSYANNSPFRFKDSSGFGIVDVLFGGLGGGEPGGGVYDPGSGNGMDGGGGYGSSGGPGYGNGGGNPGGGSSAGGGWAGGGWSGWQPVGGTSAAAPASPPPIAFNGSNYNVGTNAFSQSFGAGGNVWGAPTIGDGTVDGGSNAGLSSLTFFPGDPYGFKTPIDTSWMSTPWLDDNVWGPMAGFADLFASHPERGVPNMAIGVAWVPGLGLSTSESWGNMATLSRHFGDHGPDFASLSEDAYAQEASAFLQRAVADGLPMKIDSSGVIRVFDPATNTFGAFNANGTSRTLFTPSNPAAYWLKQPGEVPWSPGVGQ